MTGLTPDPMTSPAPDVTKWEAAKQGVSAFLLDCETAYAAAEAYVVSGVKTFRSLPANEFARSLPAIRRTRHSGRQLRQHRISTRLSRHWRQVEAHRSPMP